MNTLSYKTVSANKETAMKEWVLIDAEGEILGRLASRVAMILRGKHKTNFTPHADCGDNVIIINLDKIAMTGNKWNDKVYLKHTGYPGGQREMLAKELLAKNPKTFMYKVVKGMLPKNILGRQIINNLHVYAGAEHKHEAQQPKKIDLNTIK